MNTGHTHDFISGHLTPPDSAPSYSWSLELFTFVTSFQKTIIFVILAKARIQFSSATQDKLSWTPACAGVTVLVWARRSEAEPL